MHHALEILGAAAERVERGEHAHALVRGRAQHFSRLGAAIRADRDEIGVRAADIDADGSSAHAAFPRRRRAMVSSTTVAATESKPTQSPRMT